MNKTHELFVKRTYYILNSNNKDDISCFNNILVGYYLLLTLPSCLENLETTSWIEENIFHFDETLRNDDGF